MNGNILIRTCNWNRTSHHLDPVNFPLPTTAHAMGPEAIYAGVARRVDVFEGANLECIDVQERDYCEVVESADAAHTFEAGIGEHSVVIVKKVWHDRVEGLFVWEGGDQGSGVVQFGVL